MKHEITNFSINDITVKADQIIIAHQLNIMIYLTVEIQND